MDPSSPFRSPDGSQSAEVNHAIGGPSTISRQQEPALRTIGQHRRHPHSTKHHHYSRELSQPPSHSRREHRPAKTRTVNRGRSSPTGDAIAPHGAASFDLSQQNTQIISQGTQTTVPQPVRRDASTNKAQRKKNRKYRGRKLNRRRGTKVNRKEERTSRLRENRQRSSRSPSKNLPRGGRTTSFTHRELRRQRSLSSDKQNRINNSNGRTSASDRRSKRHSTSNRHGSQRGRSHTGTWRRSQHTIEESSRRPRKRHRPVSSRSRSRSYSRKRHTRRRNKFDKYRKSSSRSRSRKAEYRRGRSARRVRWRRSRSKSRSRSYSSGSSSSMEPETISGRSLIYGNNAEDRSRNIPDGVPEILEMDYWDRTEECYERKKAHLEKLDSSSETREQVIYNTTLKDCENGMEPNMFPYDTPDGIEHWTFWSRHDPTNQEIEDFINQWITKTELNVIAWDFDLSNLEDGLSIDIFHVHVFLKMAPKQVEN